MSSCTCILGIVTLCVVFFCVNLFLWNTQAVNIWDKKEGIKQISAVILNALLVLVGTIFVMGLQRRYDKKFQQESAVFNEKIVVYRDFLNEFENIIKDQQITDTERYELQIKLSYLSLHMANPESTKKVSRAVAAIVTKIQNPHNEDKGIMIDLMEITDVMYEELYDKTLETNSKETLSNLRDEMVLDFYGINVPPEDITAYYYIIRRIREVKRIMADSLEHNNKITDTDLYDKQWVYNGYTLVHDLYTDKDKATGKYVCNARANKYAVDLVFTHKGDSALIELFSRKNTKEDTYVLLNSLKSHNITLSNPIDNIQENGHYLYKTFNTKSVSNDTIACSIITLLRALDKCR